MKNRVHSTLEYGWCRGYSERQAAVPIQSLMHRDGCELLRGVSCWYACFRSNLVNFFPPDSEANKSAGLGSWVLVDLEELVSGYFVVPTYPVTTVLLGNSYDWGSPLAVWYLLLSDNILDGKWHWTSPVKFRNGVWLQVKRCLMIDSSFRKSASCFFSRASNAVDI